MDLHLRPDRRPAWRLSSRRGALRARLLALALCALPLACVGASGVGLGLVSEEQVRQMGLESWERIRSETAVSDEPRYRAAARDVTARLVGALAGPQQGWEVVVFEGEEANAFALPGGKIGVYEGMFDVARDEAQLAAVIAHEIGHNLADHPRERVDSQVTAQGALMLVSAALQAGNVSYANAIAGALGAGAQYGVLLPYSRDQELEADRLGLMLMARAGYDPRAAIAMWRHMEARAGARPPAFASTHPAPGQRIAHLEELMPRALAVYRGG